MLLKLQVYFDNLFSSATYVSFLSEHFLFLKEKDQNCQALLFISGKGEIIKFSALKS